VQAELGSAKDRVRLVELENSRLQEENNALLTLTLTSRTVTLIEGE
jgi:hypothetical protein